MNYQITKSLLYNFTDYVHLGLSMDEVDEIFDKVVRKRKNCFIRPVQGMLVYEIKTLLTKDEELNIIGEELTKELDIKLVENTENETITKFNRN